MKKSLFLVWILLICASFAYAENQSEEQQVDLYLFYGKGCPHCIRMQQFLQEMQEQYPNLNVVKNEVYFDSENRQLFEDMAGAFGYEVRGVPTAFIDEKVVVGFSDTLGQEIEQEIVRCTEQGCESPASRIEGKEVAKETEPKIEEMPPDIVTVEGGSSPTEDPEKTKIKEKLTVGAVMSAAAVDAINPCAFAVLIILMTTILATRAKKRALFAGLAFTLSIYISYLFMGIGLYSAIQAAGLTHTFYAVVAALAILVGLFNLKDYLWYGKWFIMEVPLSWRPKLKSLIRGVTSVPGAFLVGFAVSLFLLPCTSGPYIVILGLLAKVATRNYAFALLLIYNFIFVLPMLVITGAIYLGFTTTEEAEAWRTRRLKALHLIAGIIILLLGIGMFVAMGLGYI